jgi:formate hydrogenlyase subunit 6/NADH:ubiquinone oxidoreductase subunit I
MDALQLKFHPPAPNKYHKASVLTDPALCIGCGVCVYKCPTDSLTLVRNQEITEPPKNAREYMAHFIADRKAAMEKK